MRAKTWAAFVLTEILSVAYGLFFDGRLGFLLAAVLGMAAVLSVGSAALLRRRLVVSGQDGSGVLEKGDTVIFSAEVQNTGWLSTAFVTVEFRRGARFEPLEFEAQRFVLAPRRRRKLQCAYQTKHWGIAECGIARITVTDFLGLVTLSAEIFGETTGFTCRIMPDIPYTPPQNELLKLMCDLAPADDEEDVREIAFGLRGSPGYEHRLYEPGDSLKKINWKLSAKKDAFFVRKDEYYASSKQMFVLDTKSPSEWLSEEETAVREERVMEGLLAVLMLAAEQSMDCTLYCFFGTEWDSVRICNRADVEKQRRKFADYRFFAKPQTRLPEDMNCQRAFLLFTACCDAALTVPAGAQLVCAQSNMPENAWLISPRYEFIRPAQAGTEGRGQ